MHLLFSPTISLRCWRQQLTYKQARLYNAASMMACSSTPFKMSANLCCIHDIGVVHWLGMATNNCRSNSPQKPYCNYKLHVFFNLLNFFFFSKDSNKIRPRFENRFANFFIWIFLFEYLFEYCYSNTRKFVFLWFSKIHKLSDIRSNFFYLFFY